MPLLQIKSLLESRAQILFCCCFGWSQLCGGFKHKPSVLRYRVKVRHTSGRQASQWPKKSVFSQIQPFTWWEMLIVVFWAPYVGGGSTFFPLFLPSFRHFLHFAHLYQIPPSSLFSLAVFPSLSLLHAPLPLWPLQHLFPPPAFFCLSCHSSTHLCPVGSCSILIWCVEMSAMWEDWGWGREDVRPVKMLSHLRPLRPTERQKQDKGLYWACPSWPPVTPQPGIFLHLTLFFLFIFSLQNFHQDGRK